MKQVSWTAHQENMRVSTHLITPFLALVKRTSGTYLESPYQRGVFTDCDATRDDQKCMAASIFTVYQRGSLREPHMGLS